MRRKKRWEVGGEKEPSKGGEGDGGEKEEMGRGREQ